MLRRVRNCRFIIIIIIIIKHLTEKVTAVALLSRVPVVVDYTNNAHPTAIINKVIELALIFLISFPPIKTSSFVKNILIKGFRCILFHSYLFNETFIVNGKSHCAVMTLLLTSGLHRC